MARTKRTYKRSNHTGDCPLPGTRSHEGRCQDIVLEKSDSVVETTEPTTKGGFLSRRRSGKSPRVRLAVGKSAKKQTEKVELGDLRSNESFLLELTNETNLVGFSVQLEKQAVSYTKFSYAEDSDYDNGDLILHWKPNCDFQVHNDGLGSTPSDDYTVIMLPNNCLEIDELQDVTLGEILDSENHI